MSSDYPADHEQIIFVPLPPELGLEASLHLNGPPLTLATLRALRDSIAAVLDEIERLKTESAEDQEQMG